MSLEIWRCWGSGKGGCWRRNCRLEERGWRWRFWCRWVKEGRFLGPRGFKRCGGCLGSSESLRTDMTWRLERLRCDRINFIVLVIRRMVFGCAVESKIVCGVCFRYEHCLRQLSYYEQGRY